MAPGLSYCKPRLRHCTLACKISTSYLRILWDRPQLSAMLSIIIPVFNELATLPKVLSAVAAALPNVAKELIIIDDASTDGTREWLQTTFSSGRRDFAPQEMGSVVGTVCAATTAGPDLAVIVIYRERNQGKGAALRDGLAAAHGDVIVIQDADLEYDPQEWMKMYPLIAERDVADVVYGSRFYGAAHRSLYFHHYLGNRLISFLFNMLYNQLLQDIEVGYKMMSREVRDSLSLTSNDFGIEVEISAQIARKKKWRIYEVGITYYGRSYAEGKKIRWKDGLLALWYVVRFRFTPVP